MNRQTATQEITLKEPQLHVVFNCNITILTEGILTVTVASLAAQKNSQRAGEQ